MDVEQVAFLASGWSLASTDAHATSIALANDEETVLVDAGGQATRGLVATVGTENLDHVYLTHEHPDHTYALPGLIHHLRFEDERGPLTIHGPAPALENVRGALEALGVTCPFELNWEPLEVTQGTDDRARWGPTEHSVPTLAYRFGDVVVCGDTGPSEVVVKLAQEASLLIHEATHTDPEKTHPAGHSTPEDAGHAARKARVGALALIHIYPTIEKEEARRRTGFNPVFAPADGDVLVREDQSWTQD